MRSFLGFGQAQFIGQPQAQAIKLAGIAAQVIPLLVQWLSYGASTAKPNINILVNMTTRPCTPVDQIRGIYIDNLGSDNPVYVYFPDTFYTVVAKPNSEGWYPVLTNQKTCWIIGEGFFTGDIPQTLILISNVYVPPQVNVEIDNAVSLYRASPVITRGNSIYNAAFGIPALGDQIFSSGGLNVTVNGSLAPLWNTPYPSGFLYITNLQANLFNGNNPGTSGVFTIESTGVAGTLMNIQFGDNGNYSILNMTGLQIKLDATQTWRAHTQVPVLSGVVQLYSAFTQQP